MITDLPSTSFTTLKKNKKKYVTCDRWEEVNLLSKFQLFSYYGLVVRHVTPDMGQLTPGT